MAQAFTALSIIYLVNFPLVQLIASYPLMLAAVACFDRIQAYLMLQGQEEHLRIESPSRNSICKSPIIQQESLVAKEPATFDGLNIEVADSPSQSRTRTVSKPIVEIRNGTFAVKDATVLTAITLSVQPDSFSIVFGRVGCGKSSLLKAILGELHTTSGSVRMLDYGEGMGGVAYCGQTPWLRNISVRDNIVGTAGERFFDEKWYETVVDACELRPDIATFPSGDRSLVGSGGVSLSGGQKQRVVS